MGDWALAYAERGLVVLPLRPQDKEAREKGRYCDCTGDIGVPLIGSTDPNWVRATWTARPAANVGVVCGGRSGLLALDVDVKHNGKGALDVWRYQRSQEGLVLPDTVWYTTATGGLHYWYRLPPGLHVRRNDYWLRGVEIKACGGYVAVPPSARVIPVEYEVEGFIVRDEELRSYEWSNAVTGLADAPEWLLEDAKTRHEGLGATRANGGLGGDSGVGDGSLPPTAEFLERGLGWFTGSRNTDAFRLGCRLWMKYSEYEEHEVVAIISRAWDATVDKSGCDWAEIHAAALSARNRMLRIKRQQREAVEAYVAARERQGSPWS